MFWLAWRLLPYLMVLGGLLLAATTLPVILAGAETEPTTVQLTDVTTTSPKSRWLSVTGGGLYLPGAVVDEEIKKTTGARKTKAWYVPLVSKAEAVAQASAMTRSTTQPAIKKLVLVKFEPDEFLANYPTPDQLTPNDVFREVKVDGLRASNLLFPGRLKDFIRSDLQLPVDGVVVVKFGDSPLQRGPAMMMALILLGVALLGAVWIIARFRAPSTPPPPPLPAA